MLPLESLDEEAVQAADHVLRTYTGKSIPGLAKNCIYAYFMNIASKKQEHDHGERFDHAN